MTTTELFKLPNELLVYIASYIEYDDPISLLSLARTCQRLHACCTPSVAVRQEFTRQYEIIHDRNPLTVPKLLHSVSKPKGLLREIWHVRRAEFWGHRMDMHMWCDMADFLHSNFAKDPVTLWDEDASSNDPNEIDSETGEEWFDQELDAEIKQVRAIQAQGRDIIQRNKGLYRMFLENLYHVEKDVIELLLNEVDAGEEELLKALLLPLCSRLDTVIFIAFIPWTNRNGDHPLYILNLLTSQCHLGRTSGWFPGFISLRKISLNSESSSRKLGARQPSRDMFLLQLRDVEPLFALPNLKVLRLGGVESQANLNPDEELRRPELPDLELEPGTSSVEALELYTCDLSLYDTHRLLSLPKKLRYFQSDDPSTPTYLRTLHGAPKTLSESLERFSFRSPSSGYLWCLANYTSLRHAEGLTVDSLFWKQKRTGPKELSGPSESFRYPMSIGPGHSRLRNTPVILEALELTLPPNMETLSIRFLMMGGRGLGFFNVFLRELLRNVNGNAADEIHTGARFPHLRKVTFLLQNGALPEDFEWDESTLTGLKAHGIDVTHIQIPATDEMPEYEEVDESQWEHCFEDRHYTDPRHEVEGYEGKKFGIVRAYQVMDEVDPEFESGDEGEH